MKVRIYADGSTYADETFEDENILLDSGLGASDDYAEYDFGDANRIVIDSLVVEVTRKCNMSCAHCIRGQSEFVDVSYLVLSSLLLPTIIVNNLSITGGEPSLNIGGIFDIATIAKERNNVANFFCATNGLANQNELAHALLDMFDACTDNSSSSITVSYGKYHGTDIDDIHTPLQYFSSYDVQKDVVILREGNAAKIGTYDYTPDVPRIVPYRGEYRVAGGSIYCTCFGDIVLGCDYSYANMPKHFVTHVSDPAWPYIMLALLCHKGGQYEHLSSAMV